MLHLLSSFKLMFFKTKSKKSHQNKYLPRFGKLYSLKFPQLHSSQSVTWGRYTARKASLREFFSLFNEPFCLQMNFVTAGCRFFNQVNLGQQLSKYKRLGVTWAYQEQFLRIYTVFNRAVKMSDFSLSLEDIDLLINGKIPLIISKPGRLMQPTKFCTILFWRSTGSIETDSLFTGHHFNCTILFWRSTGVTRNRLLVLWLRFHAGLLFFLSKR